MRARKASVVLGLQWGDESKGKTVDFLCSHSSPEDTCVVRFSGGQQCAHTVINDKGYKHIFASFGSGTMRGCPTYISEHCTFYPPNMLNEWNKLVENDVVPQIVLHPLTMLTTPYDVAFNRWRESITKHGSCGIGVGATMARNLQSPYKLYAVDLLHRGMLIEKLGAIQSYYYKKCWDDYKVRVHDSMFSTVALKEMRSFEAALESPFIKELKIRPYDYLHGHENLVFEGSQGILLDAEHGIFPNVTYANTTSRNAMEICDGMEIRDIELYYVTRCYQTRHGEGWMSRNEPLHLENNEHETNVHNKYQGYFRTGALDTGLLNYSLAVDDAYSYGYAKNLVVTCLDQRKGFEFPYSELSQDFRNIYESRSPTTSFENICLVK